MREWMAVIKIVAPIILLAPIGIPLLAGYDLFRYVTGKNKKEES